MAAKHLINNIHHADCLGAWGMQRIPPRSVSLVLTDLPYGVLDTDETSWDVKLPLERLWTEWKRVLKPRGAVVLTATQPFATELINSNPRWFRYDLVWVKTRASGFLNARKRPSSAHELVLVFYDELPTYNPQKYHAPPGLIRKKFAKRGANQGGRAFKINGTAKLTYQYTDNGTRYPDTVLDFGSVYREGMHPTEKPAALFEWLIRTYTQPGAIVLDCCAGTGTTAVAAIQSGRSFICFEQERRYIDEAEARIALARSQLTNKATA